MNSIEARQVCELLAYSAEQSCSPYQKAEIWQAFTHYTKSTHLDEEFVAKTKKTCFLNKKSLASILKSRVKP